MNQIIENLLTRRSVRAFTEEEIKKEDLEIIARCGAYAPSALNGQSRQFTVVTDRAVITELSDAIAIACNREGYDMYKPVAIIIPSDERDNRFFTEDLSCALENMFLAAHSLGIGSVWLNQLRVTCDSPEVRSILSRLGIPKSHAVCGFCALGYAKNKDIPIPKKTNVIRFFD
ncbi:MAG: NAD(P)H nitroreductase [Ruminococcaceae bacterium]|nr:NAD(P)H nitroreductase [Oscillospiraceae bacterium]